MKFMKKYVAAVLFVAVLTVSVRAEQFWDPDGATIGSSISGNWDTVTPNWSAAFDAGANTTWVQGENASFDVVSNYTVTVTEPITLGGLSVSGTNGTLTIARTGANDISLGSTIFNIIGSRTLDFSATIASGSLTKSGNGVLILSGTNTYSGGTSLSSGSGSIGIAVNTVSSGGTIISSALGAGGITVNTAGHVLFASGGPRVLENPVSLNAGITIGGSQNLTFTNGNWQVNGGTRIITVTNTASTRIESNLADDGVARTLQKAGVGTLTLAGNNSGFLGALTVNANSGTLVIGSDTALQVGAVVTVNAGSTLNLNGFNGKVIGLAGAGNVALGSGTLTIANSGTSRNQQGMISGSGSLIVSNTISQQMEGTNTFSGGILLKAGTLFLRINAVTGDNISRAAGTGTITIEGSPDVVVANQTAALGGNASAGIVQITNRIVMASGRALFFASNGGTVQFDSHMTGPGGWMRDNNGSGPVVLTASNSFAGGVTLESRVLGLANKHALGTGPFIIGNVINSPASTINIVAAADLSGANAVPNTTTVNQNFTISGTNAFELSGGITISNGIRAITTSGSAPVTFSGVISGTDGFMKAGPNTLILSGANTYAGGTTVNEGTLLVNNTTGSGTGTGVVTVSGGTLGGSGIVGGAVSANSGIVSPGSSAGVLTMTNGLDLSASGTYDWELTAHNDSNNGTAGTHFDQIALTGGNLVLGGSSVLNLQFTNAASFPDITNAFWHSDHSWKIIALSGGAANPGSLNFNSISGTNGISVGNFFTTVDGSGNVFLSYVSATTPPPVIESYIAGAGTTNVTIKWSSANGVNYEVYYNDDLNTTNWTLLGSIPGIGSTTSFTDTTSPVPGKRFYRIVVP